MLLHTFQLIGGIGPARERELWDSGIETWRDFPVRLLRPRPAWLSAALEARICDALRAAQALLDRRALPELVRLFPKRECWRLYRDFQEQAVFFDIETDGSHAQNPTVVSLFHARGIEVFVAGRNLDELPTALSRWPLWVSFNGTLFDEPVLRQHLPSLARPALHLDLRFFARSLGLSGGLKKIETALGFGRPEHLHGVNGLDAIHLWERFQRCGDTRALKRLVEYNIYDSIQLKTLVETLYNRAIDASCAALSSASAKALSERIERFLVFARGDVLRDVSRLVDEVDEA
ncbi:MAG: ribonuclease H-like domain-containing protein [Myxococcales bacterium]|jgi:uncharacterized protein YprB with RNaseH-like and TPR domain|nr:ribonuclease H-like domain-containing protein [Myxococcales bacterium]